MQIDTINDIVGWKCEIWNLKPGQTLHTTSLHLSRTEARQEAVAWIREREGNLR